MVVSVNAKILFEDLVDAFRLTVSFGVVSCGKVGLDMKGVAEGGPESGDKVTSPIGDNILWSAVLGENVFDE